MSLHMDHCCQQYKRSRLYSIDLQSLQIEQNRERPTQSGDKLTKKPRRPIDHAPHITTSPSPSWLTTPPLPRRHSSTHSQYTPTGSVSASAPVEKLSSQAQHDASAT